MEPIRAQVHAPPAHAERITTVVTLAGLRPTRAADLALLVTDRDDPGATDRWLVDSLPHLVVSLGPETVRVGPFVQPGLTACVRCVAVGGSPATRGLAALLVPSGPLRAQDLDDALLVSALGCAVRDLATWQHGGVPLTWSSSLTLSAHRPPELERWPRHPHCGCSWGPLDHRAAEQRRHLAG